ncbi:MAG: NADPH:quinone oxidoreductase [Sandaracinus sp.]|nr:NADPH:quinone oxidoreductase [Sandaracinus sp.]MAQ19486.1 NADPH:quinone oxidoreductase [Sandaracinus sp.]|tara:strand:+ start:2725 stop:3693 length:969 start_codon:yes stop_codon:yes gene_type:complete
MRAAMVTEFTGPEGISVQELADPTPKKGQVVVKVAAAGVNFPDLLMTRDMYQLKPPPPFACGGEIAGEIIALGEGLEGWEVGERVMALLPFGGFATHVALSARQLVRVPDTMDLETAAAFAFTYGTSYHALVDRGALATEERLLVLGAAGGVGLAAVEIGAALGAEVVAAASTDEKLALCRAHGAKHTIRYDRDDLKKAAKAVGGVDVVYDPVGGDLAEPALRSLQPGGRHLVIGFAAGSIPAVRWNLALLKECSIVGVAWGAWAMRHPDAHAANMAALFRLHADGALRPHVSERYALDETADALRAMDERKVLGKVVIVPG